jgi:hypothetical protein
VNKAEFIEYLVSGKPRSSLVCALQLPVLLFVPVVESGVAITAHSLAPRIETHPRNDLLRSIGDRNDAADVIFVPIGNVTCIRAPGSLGDDAYRALRCGNVGTLFQATGVSASAVSACERRAITLNAFEATYEVSRSMLSGDFANTVVSAVVEPIELNRCTGDIATRSRRFE